MPNLEAIRRALEHGRTPSFKTPGEFNRQLSAIGRLDIRFERLDYWKALFAKLLSGDEGLALQWLQYATDSAAETTLSAREHLRRVEAELAGRDGAGEEKPKPPQTMMGREREKIK